MPTPLYFPFLSFFSHSSGGRKKPDFFPPGTAHHTIAVPAKQEIFEHQLKKEKKRSRVAKPTSKTT
jgi:hypothetical protein